MTGDAVFSRPRTLVERELQARIEARTASGFLQRRRAARTARRIASLPDSLFTPGVVVERGAGAWSPLASQSVIDIPVDAIHETPRTALPAPAATDAADASRRPWRRWKPARSARDGDEQDVTGIDRDRVEQVERAERVDHVVDVVVVEVVDEAGVAKAGVVEVIDVEEAVDVVEAVEEPAPDPAPFTPEPEPAAEQSATRAAGRAAAIGTRWRAWKAARNRIGNGAHADAEDTGDDAAVVPPAVGSEEAVAHQPYDWEADEPADRGGRPRTRALRIPDRWRTWKPPPRDTETDAPARPAASPRPPAPPRRRRRVEPRDVAPAAHAPRGAENWQPSESLWARRVFNSQESRSGVANWPRRTAPKQDVTSGE